MSIAYLRRSFQLCLCIFVTQTFAQKIDFNTINFNKADSIALHYKGENLNSLPELSYKLTAQLETDVERFRAIYMWVCKNIANDYSLFYKNQRKRKKLKNDSTKLKHWNASFRKTVFKTLLKRKKTVCTGYAYIVKELARFANLECVIINGFGRTSTTNPDHLTAPNHSWNAVKLEGKWYLCDPTWASGIQSATSYKFKFRYNDGFFLANPQLFAINHFPLDASWSLLNESTIKFKEFLEAPVLYGNAYKILATHEHPKKMHHKIRKRETLSFQYKLLQPITKDAIVFLIDDGFKSKKIKPSSMTIKNEYLTLEHPFNTLGFYDVHLYINDDIIATYTVKVTP